MANSKTARKRKSGGVLVSILITIVVPVLILNWLSGEDRLGPVVGLVVALAFPLGYGLWEFFGQKSVNFYSVLGFVGVLLTGGIGLLALPVQWLAIKEAAVPGVIAVVVVVSQYTRWPVLKTLLRDTIHLETVEAKLTDGVAEAQYQQRLRVTTYLVAGSFVLSAVLNYYLARRLVVSDAGTEAFNVELARLTALSYPVIVIPSLLVLMVALLYLLAGIKRLTGLTLEDLTS